MVSQAKAPPSNGLLLAIECFAMSEEDLGKIREAGEKMGRLISEMENLRSRVDAMELRNWGLIGAIVAAWAKSKGFW